MHRDRVVIDLPLTREAPGLARTFLQASICPPHGFPVVDDAMLLASEVVTNAVLHGGPPIRLALDCLQTGVEIRVSDANHTPPRLREASEDDEGGRGLQLVDLLSADWGVDEHPDDGKDVWFRLIER